jgi:hypothetical protein
LRDQGGEHAAAHLLVSLIKGREEQADPRADHQRTPWRPASLKGFLDGDGKN